MLYFSYILQLFSLSLSEVEQWSDFLKIHLHPNSVVPLPLKSGHAYDHFFAGKDVATHLTADGGEDMFDKLRLMIEECDHLTCVNMMADLDDGFGGLGAQYLQYLRDEVRGATLPVWAFPEVAGNEGARSDGTHSKKQMLNSLGVSAAMCSLADLSSMLVPIDARSASRLAALPGCFSAFEDVHVNADSIFHSSGLVASVIETITGCQRVKLNSAKGQTESVMRENAWSPQEFIYRATRGGTLPVCNVDAGFGFPSTVAEAEALLSRPSPEVVYADGLRATPAQPFLSPLSSAYAGSWGVSSSGPSRVMPPPPPGGPVGNRSIFTNLLFARGNSAAGVREAIITKCGQYSSVVNSFQHRAAPLPLPLCFPDIFPRRLFSSSDDSLLSKYYYNGRMSNLDMMASVNTSTAVGHHLALHAKHWQHTARGMKAQLAQLGCDAEESEEMEEKLLSLSERYDNSH
jgi:hypothetical protein